MTLTSSMKLLGGAVAAFGLLLSFYQYVETRRVEAAKPYLEKQLALCVDATRITSWIATDIRGGVQQAEKIDAFWRLYWGEMGLVEHKPVEQAMKEFGDVLKTRTTKTPPEKTVSEGDFSLLSLKLAHACREELAASWRTDAWRR